MNEPIRCELFAVELRTAQWERLLQWYRQTLGLRCLVRIVEDGYALLAAGPSRVALLARRETGAASGRVALVFEVEDLDSAAARLRQADSPCVGPHLHPEGFSELTTADPDGNRVRLFAWPPGSRQ